MKIVKNLLESGMEEGEISKLVGATEEEIRRAKKTDEKPERR